jgi:DNA invertase Pin-like site-specific DNA recombinase
MTADLPRVAIYARYSSDRQSENSIEDQLRICRAHAHQKGWSIVAEFQDAAISGATQLRPGFQALQAAMRTGSADLVLAEALDRFSRDQEHVAAFYKLARFTGARLVTIGEGQVDELHVGLKGTMNALYLKDLAAKTFRGMEGRLRAGRHIGAPAFGYRRVIGVLRPDGEPVRGLREIVPEKAALVRRIFDEYAAGSSVTAIVRRLNAEGVPGPTGKSWNQVTIRGRSGAGDGMLRNRNYIGEIVWNRRQRVVDPETGTASKRHNAVEQHVLAEVPDARIIDQLLWEKVQARLTAESAPRDPGSSRPRFWERRHPRHLLSGKIFCGVCNGPFAANRGRYYSCNGVRRGICTNRKTVERKALETRVLGILANQMMDPELAEAFAEEFTREWNRLAAEGSATEGRVRRELDGVTRKIDGLVDAIANGMRGSSLQAKLSALETDRDRLEQSLAAVKPTKVRLLPNLGALYRRQVGNLRDALAKGEADEAIEAARVLIERVVIHPTPKGRPPGVSMDGRLAAMLTAAQPELSPAAANAIAAATALAVREGQGGQRPRGLDARAVPAPSVVPPGSGRGTSSER